MGGQGLGLDPTSKRQFLVPAWLTARAVGVPLGGHIISVSVTGNSLLRSLNRLSAPARELGALERARETEREDKETETQRGIEAVTSVLLAKTSFFCFCFCFGVG